MRWRRELSKFGALFRRAKPVDDLEAEIRSHLEMEEQENREAGMSAEESHYAALRRFGNVTSAQERSREMWGWNSVEALLQDLRYGLRQLRRNPGFACVAVLTLALGIGANTTIFSTISLILLEKPPVRDPDRVMTVVSTNPSKGEDLLGVSVPNFESFQKQNDVFRGIAAAEADKDFTLTGEGAPEHLTGMAVTPNYFDVLGLTPAIGRNFVPNESQAGHNHVVILSHGLWKQHFASGPNVVGKQVQINGEPYTVVGVMPPGTDMSLFQPQLWTPVAFGPSDFGPSARNNRYLDVFARLRPGVTTQQAQAEITTIAYRITQNHSETEKGWSARVLSLQEYLIESVHTGEGLSVLMGAVAFVLLIACANIAGLQLTRAAGRRQEIATRVALGAGRFRLIRQLLVENLLIAIAGGALGLLLAWWGIDLLRLGFNFNSFAAALASGLYLDRRTLWFTVAITLATALGFGLAPALQASKPDLAGTLKEGGRTGTGGLARSKMRSVLVAVEIALAVVLVAGAGLFTEFFIMEITQNPGFNPKHVVTAGISLSSSSYKDNPPKQAAFFEQVILRIRNLPGVESVSAARDVPLGGSWWRTVHIEGQQEAQPAAGPSADVNLVGSQYFKTMEIPLIQGRVFSQMDDTNSPKVALVNRAFARKYFPKGNVVGRRILVDTSRPEWAEIVGIVGDVKEFLGQRESSPQVYEPYLQQPSDFMALAVRTRYAAAALAPMLRRTAWSVDRDQPIDEIMTMHRVAQANLGGDSLMTELMGAFAGLALILAAVGIYGVIAYSVAQRTHEIGIRMALGAKKSDVLLLVFRQGSLLTAIGCIVGLALALPLLKLFAAIFYGFTAGGPISICIISIVVAIVSLLATYIPARRATKVDPMIALRHE